MEFDSTTMTPCECDPTKPNPCGPGSDCINRYLLHFKQFIIYQYVKLC